MEEVASELDSKFQDAERRLDLVTWKVDQLVKDDVNGGENISVGKLLSGLQEVKKEFVEVTREVEELKNSQQAAMASILQEFQVAMAAAEELKDKLGDVPENEEK